MFILVDRWAHRIIATVQTLDIVDNKWVRSVHGSLIQLDMIGIAEFESIPRDAQFYKDNKFYAKNPIEVEAENDEIKKQLEELDKKSIRDSEDILELLVKKGIVTLDEVPFVKARKEQKQELRKKLK